VSLQLRLAAQRRNVHAVFENNPITFGGAVMKRSLIGCLLGSILLTSAVWCQSDKGGATQQAVAALEQTWLKSQQTNNPELVAPLLADNFMQTTSDGKLTTSKAEALAEAKSIKWSSVDYIDVKVTVFGNTAIATGGFKAKGTATSGKAIDENSRFTDTWVKMPSGKWQCVASQDTPVT
jgi:uncharacterized protein (TIGR02246 family)